MPKIVLFALLFNLTFFAFATASARRDTVTSVQYPQNYFRPPLDLAPALSGSFGELRGGHFHSGLDYRTLQRVGHPVHAAADGFISRIRVQLGGGGNALYIAHPNGYSTVYMHLQRFNPQIAQTLKDYQYRQKSFDVDFPLFMLEIPVKKGEIIGWSGNSGSSGGPHLHFEIRDSKTEETINAQLFGIPIPDRVKPTVSGMYMYRLNGQPFNEKTVKQYFQVLGSAGKYQINKAPVINLSGEVGFGIITTDKHSSSQNTLGVYSIELFMDNRPIYSSVWERFFFHHSRAINSHLDYPALLTTGRRIQKSFIEPGNPLTIYKDTLNRGLINLQDDEVHDMRYVVKDVAGNINTLNFKVKFNPTAVIAPTEKTENARFLYNQNNEFNTALVKINIPRGALYSDVDFKYSVSAKPAGAYSAMHNIHTRLIPLHQAYSLAIKADSTLPEYLKSKLLLVDSRRVSQGGAYEDGYVKANPRAFGSFFITSDTVSPRITPVNMSDGKSMANISKMTFKISDNLSGIKSFYGTIDGQWILMEFDPKTATLWHTFDEQTRPGKHLFQLVVTDMKMNTKTYNASFFR